jgi:hypothetical protein
MALATWLWIHQVVQSSAPARANAPIDQECHVLSAHNKVGCLMVRMSIASTQMLYVTLECHPF